MRSDSVPTLLVTGTIGAGKTAVATEIGDVLAKQGRPNAVVDLDWLGWVHVPQAEDSAIHALIARNLSAIWPNLRSVGIRYLVLVRAIRDRAELEALRRAVPEADIRVVRLTASATAVADRLRQRDTGPALQEHLDETQAFTDALDRARLEDIVVSNQGRPVRDVALEVMRRVGWM